MSDERWRGWLKMGGVFALILALLALVFVVSFRMTIGATTLPEDYELPQLLLAATSVALLFWSVILAVLAVIGWRRIKAAIEEEARVAVEEEAERVQDRFEELRNDIRGKVHLFTGVIYGRLAIIKADEELRVGDPEYLALSIDHLQRAVEHLDGQPGEEFARNCLAFSYAVSGRPEYGMAARDLAMWLRRDPIHSTDPAFLNTYGRVVASYARYFDDPERVTIEARDALQSMVDNPDVSETEKQNARRHLTVLNRALDGDGGKE